MLIVREHISQGRSPFRPAGQHRELRVQCGAKPAEGVVLDAGRDEAGLIGRIGRGDIHAPQRLELGHERCERRTKLLAHVADESIAVVPRIRRRKRVQ